MISNPKILLVFVFCLTFQHITSVKLQAGELQILVAQQQEEQITYTHNLQNNKIDKQIPLTQSTRVTLKAKLSFSQESFIPQIVTFRLRHPKYQNLTEPVLAKYSSQQQQHIAYLDLGNPSLIKPFSSLYQLELIIADQSLDQNIRTLFADCDVNFRKSLESVPQSELYYKTEQIIETAAPAQRVDPPMSFTLFVMLLIVALDGIFVYGLKHMKVNVSLFPKSSSGFLLNLGLLLILMANLAVLIKFWLNWTFLETLKYLLALVLPTAVIANYALVHVQKH